MQLSGFGNIFLGVIDSQNIKSSLTQECGIPTRTATKINDTATKCTLRKKLSKTLGVKRWVIFPVTTLKILIVETLMLHIT